MMKRLTKHLLNFFYPNRCPACQSFLTAEELLCESCAAALPLPMDKYCHQCGKPDCICAEFQPSYSHAVVCTAYQGGTIPAIIGLKNSTNTNFAYYAAKIIAERFQASKFPMPDLVTSVPMHPSKQRLRGYNQSELIAKETARLLRIPYRGGLLTRSKSRIDQHTLNRAERLEHVEVFQKREGVSLDGIHILLCDDVLTTGSTLHRCSALLIESGAAMVSIGAAATTLKKDLS